MADLILDIAALDRIKARLAAFVADHEAARDPLAEALVQDAAHLIADLETLRHRIDQAATKIRQASLWLDGRAHTAADPR
jgi:hypothetical protein